MATTDGKRATKTRKKAQASNKKRAPKEFDLLAIRRALARADFFFGLIDGVSEDYRPGRWTRVLVLAVIDAGQNALDQAIGDLDRILPRK